MTSKVTSVTTKDRLQRLLADTALKKHSSSTDTEGNYWILRTTSGTTGGQPIVFKRKVAKIAVRHFDDFHRLVTCQGSRCTRLTNTLLPSYDCPEEKQKSTVLHLDFHDLDNQVSTLLSDYQPDSLLGLPSFMLRLAEKIEPETRSGIKNIRLLGEIVTDSVVGLLQQSFPHARIRSIYTATELGMVAHNIKCNELSINQYHPAPGVVIEISEPDKTGAGDIFISKHLDKDNYVERYAIGDVGRLITKPCPCGQQITLEHLGRNGYDYIKLAGTLLVRKEFDRVLHKFPWIMDWRVEASGEAQGKILLKVFAGKLVPTESLRSEVCGYVSKHLFLTATKTLDQLVKEKDFAPLEMEWLSEPIHKDAKIIRLKRVV